MKRNAIISALFILVLSFFITGCKEDNVKYEYKYEVIVNKQVVTDEIFTKSGSVNNYIVNIDNSESTTDLEVIFNIYEKPLRDREFNPTELLKNTFKVSTIYNDFTNTVASNKQVEIDKEKYNKYSITYTFDDIKDKDVVTIKLNDDIVKDLELIDNEFEISFKTN